MAANVTHHVEVVIPAGVTVKQLGENNPASGGKLQIIANSEVSLAAAKAQVGALGTAVTAAAA